MRHMTCFFMIGFLLTLLSGCGRQGGNSASSQASAGPEFWGETTAAASLFATVPTAHAPDAHEAIVVETPTSFVEVSAAAEASASVDTAVPASTDAEVPAWRVIAEDELNLYLAGTGEPIEGKINIVFYPDNRNAKGEADPDIQVLDSWRIRHPEEMRQVCQAILNSPLYDPDLYGRTLDSMVTEWKAHNHVNQVYDNPRTRHVDFNRADEGLSYWQFWQRAIQAVSDRAAAQP